MEKKNHLRDEAIRSLADKRPLATMNRPPMGIWLGRSYTYRKNTDDLRQHFLPDFVFEMLEGGRAASGYCGEIYDTVEAAQEALDRVRVKLAKES